MSTAMNGTSTERVVLSQHHVIGWTADNERVSIDVEVTQDDRLTYLTDLRPIIGSTRISICGSVYAGRVMVSGGQCTDSLLDVVTFAPGWDAKKVFRLWRFWNRWHLNDLTPGCKHQHQGNYSDPAISGQYCDKCNYRYGHKWLYRQPPQQAIDYLARLGQ